MTTFTIQDAATLDPAALADELTKALGSNFGISTAGGVISTNTNNDTLDVVKFQAVLDLHVAAAPARAQAKIVAALENSVQQHLDSEARKLGYDSLMSAISYVGDANPAWDADGKSFRNWRSAVWSHCHAQTTIVTEDELIAGLPARI